jgi:DNA-binding transcriptional regulator GbsR (MarR family)
MKLDEPQKAVLLALLYMSGDEQTAAGMSSIINISVVDIHVVIRGLRIARLVESRIKKVQVYGRWSKYTTVTYYKLTNKGTKTVKHLLKRKGKTDAE